MNQNSIVAALRSPSGDAFLNGAWPCELFVSHGELGRLPAVLSSPQLALDDVLRSYPGAARASLPFPSPTGELVSRGQATECYRAGRTVSLDAIGSCVEGLPHVQSQLESDLGLRPRSSKAVLFCSPAGEGLPQHFDCYDVMLVQLRGNKRMVVSERPALPMPFGEPHSPFLPPQSYMYAQALEGFPDADGCRMLTVEMQPGTVLYMPRGTWHQSLALTESAALSFALFPPLALDHVLEMLRMVLLQDPRWRRPLYGLHGPAAARAEAARQVAELLPELAQRAALLGLRHAAGTTLAPAERFAAIDWTSEFHRVPTATLAVTDSDAAARPLLRLGGSAAPPGQAGTELAVPSELLPACRWLTQRRAAFSAAELRDLFPGIPGAAVIELLRALVHAGVLVLLWFPIAARRLD